MHPTAVTPSESKTKSTSWFRTVDGKNYAYIFLIVSSLFLLWGVCNGMLDVLNKHFQDSLELTKAESAWVQFANYMGYFIMAIPAGLIATRFGYKGGILTGLFLVALGALWFIPATHIGTYWAFLLGLFILAAGLPCLETVCNPYATVLGPPGSGTARINLAQSANGVGWVIGPVLGGFFVLSATGEPITNNSTLYEPYLIIAALVVFLILVFAVSKVPDLHNIEEAKVEIGGGIVVTKPLYKRWHFTLAVAAQFLYVAAQTGIFSFFINYTAADTPALSVHQANGLQNYANVLHICGVPQTPMTYSAAMFVPGDFPNVSELVAKLQNDSDPQTLPISQYIWRQFSADQQVFLASSGFAAYANQIRASSSITQDAADIDQQIIDDKKALLVKELNQILQSNTLFTTASSSGISLSDAQRKLFASNPTGEQLDRANRQLMEDTYSSDLIARNPYLNASLFRITDRGSSLLLAFGGFLLFLFGRITGSFALRVVRPHLMLLVYSVANILMMILTMNAWGWYSVAGLFLSFFFMSITYPTIFSLGIHGLGEKTKIASSFIVMSIVGGALMPFLMGWLADTKGMRFGFLMPLICFIFIALYGAIWQKLEAKDSQSDDLAQPSVG
ncbi:MAG TPA: MFS transporter [Phycisphaerae bacterium]|nr:MFS transporter [Phycisphaerae bacterium]